MHQLNSYGIGPRFPAIVELYKQFKKYTKDGEEQKIKIEFPELNKCIKGHLVLFSVSFAVFIHFRLLLQYVIMPV